MFFFFIFSSFYKITAENYQFIHPSSAREKAQSVAKRKNPRGHRERGQPEGTTGRSRASPPPRLCPQHPLGRGQRKKKKTTHRFSPSTQAQGIPPATGTDNSPVSCQTSGPLSCQTWNVLSGPFPSLSAQRAFAHKRTDGFLLPGPRRARGGGRGEGPRLGSSWGCHFLGMWHVPRWAPARRGDSRQQLMEEGLWWVTKSGVVALHLALGGLTRDCHQPPAPGPKAHLLSPPWCCH